MNPRSGICVFRREDDTPCAVVYGILSDRYLVVIYADAVTDISVKTFSELLDIVPCRAHVAHVHLPIDDDLQTTLLLWKHTVREYLASN